MLVSLKQWFYISKRNHYVFPQKLRNFHSLSCLGITGEDSCESNQDLLTLRSTAQCNTDNSSANELSLEDIRPRTKEGEFTGNTSSDPAIEEADWSDTTPETTNGKDYEPLWAGLCSMRKDVYQLGGELDIEQIERNWAGLSSSWGGEVNLGDWMFITIVQ